jgi:hypothetical protein
LQGHGGEVDLRLGQLAGGVEGDSGFGDGGHGHDIHVGARGARRKGGVSG